MFKINLVVREAQLVGQKRIKLKVVVTEAAVEQISRVARKTKQKWMTKNISEPMERGQVKKI